MHLDVMQFNIRDQNPYTWHL